MPKLHWIVLSLLMIFTACSSDKSKIEIYFNTNPSADSIIYYEVYAERRESPSGFTIKDSMEYDKKLTAFYLGKIYGDSTDVNLRYPTTIRKGYVIVGVIAYNGIRSTLSASKIIKLNGEDIIIIN